MSVDVRHDLESLHHDISLEETEDTWEKIAKAINALNRICESSGAYENQPSEVVLALKNYHRPIASAMASERTRLSGCTLDMLLAAATGLGSAFEPLLSLYIPPLLALCARTNKVVINRARGALLAVIETAQLVGVLSYFVHSTKDKSASLRLVIAECTLACLNSCNPPDLEKESRMKEIESIIRTFTRDANADVRKISRKVFESYKILFPHRVDLFTAPMSPTMKKYLDIKSGGMAAPVAKTSAPKLDLKTIVKPSSNSASTSTTGPQRPMGHSRTGSSSSVNSTTQGKNLAESMTRVRREKAPTTGPGPLRPARTVVDRPAAAQRSVTASRLMAPPPPPEPKETTAPLRPQRSVISRSATAPGLTSTGAPTRLVIKSEPIPTDVVSTIPESFGPRRVPIPIPIPTSTQPAPADVKLADEPKRTLIITETGAKTADEPVKHAPPTAAPTTAKAEAEKLDQPKRTVPKLEGGVKRAPMAPPAAPVKKTATPSVSLRDRVTSSKPVLPSTTRPKPTSSQSTAIPGPSNSQMKPKLPPNSLTTTVAGGAPPARSKSVSQSTAVAGPSTKSKSAAPPPQTKPSASTKPAPRTGGLSKPTASSAQRSAIPTKTLAKKPSVIRKVSSLAVKRRPVTPVMVPLPPSPEPGSVAEEMPQQADIAPVPVDEMEAPATPPPETLEEGPIAADEDSASRAPSPMPSAPEAIPPSMFGTGAILLKNYVSPPPPPDMINGVPRPKVFETLNPFRPPMTPNSHMQETAAAFAALENNPAFANKTPITSLMLSIEQGFEYSPYSPLSPPSGYANGNIPVRQPRLDGPMLAFNHALHSPSLGYGKKERELVPAELGVVGVDSTKLFNPTQIGLDDPLGSRGAFIPVNQ